MKRLTKKYRLIAGDDGYIILSGEFSEDSTTETTLTNAYDFDSESELTAKIEELNFVYPDDYIDPDS